MLTSEGSSEAQALGRSWGGFGTKAHVLADARGRATALAPTPGQAAERPQAEGLLAFLPGTPLWTMADRGHSSHALRETIRGLGSMPAIPTRTNEAPVACRGWMCRHRNLVERLWSRFKEWRCVATRHEKTAASFLPVLSLAATFGWTGSQQALAGRGGISRRTLSRFRLLRHDLEGPRCPRGSRGRGKEPAWAHRRTPRPAPACRSHDQSALSRRHGWPAFGTHPIGGRRRGTR